MRGSGSSGPSVAHWWQSKHFTCAGFPKLWTQCPISCKHRLTRAPPTAGHCRSSSAYSQSSLSAPSPLLLLEVRTKGTQTTHICIINSATGRHVRAHRNLIHVAYVSEFIQILLVKLFLHYSVTSPEMRSLHCQLTIWNFKKAFVSRLGCSPRDTLLLAVLTNLHCLLS